MRRSFKRRVLGVAVLAGLAGPSGAAVVDSVWIGGTGNWTLSTNWSPAGVPDNGVNTYNVAIDGGSAAGSVVTLNQSATIAGLTLDAGDELRMGSGRTLDLSGLGNSGTITFQDSKNYTRLNLLSNIAIGGNGTISLSHPTYDTIVGTAGANWTLSNGAGHRIQGAGKVGGNTINLINAGPIDANLSGIILTIDPQATVVNTGILQASVGGILVLEDGAYNNAGGTVQGMTAGVVSLRGAQITSGVLRTTDTGLIKAEGSGNLVADLTVNGSLDIASGGTLGIQGTITNNGVIATRDAANNTRLYLQADATLAGTGSVVLSHPAWDAITGPAGGNWTLTNGAGHRIQGAGKIGGNTINLINPGTIDANVSGVMLTVDPQATLSNTGILQASVGGILVLEDGAYGNAGGTIQAVTGGVASLRGAQITNGILRTTDTGLIRAEGSGNLAVNLTVNGNLDIASGGTLGIQGTIINNGQIATRDAANNTRLYLQADATLAGTGSVVLSHPVWDAITGPTGANVTLTNSAGHTIQGAGQVGDNLLDFVNQGILDANVSGKNLTVDPKASLSSSGALRASGGGTLLLNGGTYTISGLVQATGGGEVKFATATGLTNYDAATHTLTGGRWTAEAGSTILIPTASIETNAANVTLSGVGSTFDAINALTENAVGGEFHVMGGRTFVLPVTTTNHGKVEVGVGSVLQENGAFVQLGTQAELIVNGTLQTLGGAVAILNGKVGGNGTISGPTNLGPGLLSPGQSAGTLSFQSLHIQSGASYDFEIDGPIGDRANVLGTGIDFTIDSNGSYHVSVSILNATGMLNEYVMFAWAGDDPLTNEEWLELGRHTTWSLPPGYGVAWEYRTAENQIVMNIVPEPASLWLLGAAALLLVRGRRRAGV